MNNLILKAHLEGVEELDINQRLFLAGKLHSTEFNKWFRKATINLLKAVREAGPKGKRVAGTDIAALGKVLQADGFNSCLSTFTSAIDEGIKGIEKGDV